jgi:hypothetical protein
LRSNILVRLFFKFFVGVVDKDFMKGSKLLFDVPLFDDDIIIFISQFPVIVVDKVVGVFIVIDVDLIFVFLLVFFEGSC